MAATTSDLKAKAEEAFIDDLYEVAAVLYTQAITLDPKPELYADRAQANIKLLDFTEAIADANRAIEMDPSMAKAYMRKGIACLKLEEYQTAKAALEKGASLASGDSRFVNLIKKCDECIEGIKFKSQSASAIIVNSDGFIMEVSEDCLQWLSLQNVEYTNGRYRLPYPNIVLSTLFRYFSGRDVFDAATGVRLLIPEHSILLFEAANLLEAHKIMDFLCEMLVKKLIGPGNDIREQYASRVEFRNNIMRRDRVRVRTLAGRMPPKKIISLKGADLQTRNPFLKALSYDNIGTSMKLSLESGDPLSHSRCLESFEPFLKRGYDIKGIYLPPTCCEYTLNLVAKVLHRGELFSHSEDKQKACLIIAHLSDKEYIPFSEAMLTRLAGLISIEDPLLASSALFVVGNIVRWGSMEQIQILNASDIITHIGGLLIRVGGDMRIIELSTRAVLIEAMQILSILASQSERPIKSMYVDSVVFDPLCLLLLDGVADIRVEAAWALFYVSGFLL